jgi:hypothetical protein
MRPAAAMTDAALAIGASDRWNFLAWVRIVGSLVDLPVSGTKCVPERPEPCVPPRLDSRPVHDP